ncbi:MAG: lycopene cyclase domain-containing protein [Ferruginibacter sp.]|nr:lycopene cyclase domain-containing protein [Ferruginibacter sp.]
MNTHYTYFLILAAAIAGPFTLSFDKKVGFYKKWKYLFPAMIIPALVYIAWDIYFTSKGVWSFNENYITGKKLVNLPVEEVLFFLVVPYCCVFIYECIRCYFPNLKNRRAADILLQVLAIVLMITGIFFYKKYYTSWTFVSCSVFIAVIYGCRKFFKNFDAASFLVAFAIILIPFLIVNGFLTAIPVVLYNNAENLNIRIYTIPFEDVFYGMLLVMMDIAFYEKMGSRGSLTSIK